MKYFLDTEFLEDGHTIELISIGVVCEDGREFYAVNKDMPLDRIAANWWHVENIFPHLPVNFRMSDVSPTFKDDPTIKTRKQITQDLIEFVTGDNIEIWGYYPAYDWVAICRLFGRMIDLPEHWPKFAYNLRQWLNHKGLGHIRQPDDAPHHALEDARWVAATHKKYYPCKLNETYSRPSQ